MDGPTPAEIKVDFDAIAQQFIKVMQKKMRLDTLNEEIGNKAVDALMNKVADGLATAVHQQLLSKQIEVPMPQVIKP